MTAKSYVLGVCLLPVALTAGAPTREEAPGPAPAEHARLSLLNESTTVVPGETFFLGVDLRIDPGWHVYWNGLNDTGFPVTVTPRLPAGFTAGDLLWPAPERHVSPGNILDHVYRGRVTLLLPVTAPADLEPGARFTFGVEAQWLTCEKVCIPGSGTASVSMTVGPEAVPASKAARARFAWTRSRLPEPAPEGALAASWRGAALVITVPGALGMTFYPAADCVPPSHPVEDAVSDSDVLRLRFDGPPEDSADPRIAGVVEAREASETRFYRFEIPFDFGS